MTEATRIWIWACVSFGSVLTILSGTLVMLTASLWLCDAVARRLKVHAALYHAYARYRRDKLSDNLEGPAQ